MRCALISGSSQARRAMFTLQALHDVNSQCSSSCLPIVTPVHVVYTSGQPTLELSLHMVIHPKDIIVNFSLIEILLQKLRTLVLIQAITILDMAKLP